MRLKNREKSETETQKVNVICAPSIPYIQTIIKSPQKIFIKRSSTRDYSVFTLPKNIAKSQPSRFPKKIAKIERFS